MNKIKLVFSSVNLEYGGIEKSLLNLVNSLDLNKYDLTIVLEEKKGIYLNKINKNVKILEYKPNSNKNIIIRKLNNFINKVLWLFKHYHKYDVAICYASYSMPANFIARVSAKKRIFWVHSNYCVAFEYDENKIRGFFDVRYLNKFDKLVFVSNEAKEDLIKYYPNIKNKSVTLNNIIDVDEIINNSNCALKLKNNFKNIAVFVGRMDEEVKKVSRIIKLAKKCQQGKKDILFLLVGDGPDLLNLKVQADDYNLNNIIFTGAQINPYPYLKKANFLLLTSKYEGFPVVYNEAIVLKKPILSTINVSDDEISINGNFGIICSEEDLFKNVDNILKFKNQDVDFIKINEKRIKKLEKLIGDLYEK